MATRRASLILPCNRLEDFPTHLTGQSAAELLAAWTALWHPALLATTGHLAGWHPADQPPDPSTLDEELVLVPSVSRHRLPDDWCEHFAVTSPQEKPPLVDARSSRDQTMAAALAAAGIGSATISKSLVRDFLALGYAHLQVELLTRAMHYAPVLDTEQFAAAVIEAAVAAVGGNDEKAHDELARAFDLLMDARNHVYSVDYYVVDVTLLAVTTLGEPLQAKLAAGSPTSLLASGALLEQMASEFPQTLRELQRAIEAGTACVVGGSLDGRPASGRSPEAILADLMAGREIARRHLGRPWEVFGQFGSAFSPFLPEVLSNCGFNAALHAAFDGRPFPKAQQRKTRWGARDGAQIDALSATPLDAAQPETWLKLAERVSDSIAHDHVATVLLASWPGHAAEYFDDMWRAAAFAPVLGKPVTLEEYFRITREIDDWSTFDPAGYESTPLREPGANAISLGLDEHRQEIVVSHDRSAEALIAIAGGTNPGDSTASAMAPMAINAWNFPCGVLVGFDPIRGVNSNSGMAAWLPDVPGCGFALVDTRTASAPPSPLAEGRTLHNELLEVVIHEASGGIQSLKSHRDRRTRLSQRLVVHDERTARSFRDAHRNDSENGPPQLETQMLADRIEVTRADDLAGEVTSRGRILDAGSDLLAHFKQTVRLARGMPAAIVDIELDVARAPDGDLWDSYFASRMAWSGDALSVRRGVEWIGRPTTRSQIESREWVQISDGDGSVNCYCLGLPYHRLASPTWLDSLLVVAGEERRRFQFALGIDGASPTQTALSIATSGHVSTATWANRPVVARGWFLHIGAKNLIVTHIEPIANNRAGVRLRILETAGLETRTKLSAYRPILAARSTDFLGQQTSLLSVVEGQVPLDIGPHRWRQIEAEW